MATKPETDRSVIELRKQVDFHKNLNKMLGTILLGILFMGLRLLLPTAHAASVMPAVSNASAVDMGIFVDPMTGNSFSLVSHIGNDKDVAWQQYLANPHVNVSNVRRDWKDCQKLSTLQWAACNTAHGFAGGFKTLSASTLGAYINDEINSAFTGGRDNQNPRSICHVYDNQNLCVSWANYDTHTLKNGESGDIGGFAAKCVKQGWSSEFKATDSNNGVIYICVSDRASGCGSGVCGQ